MQRTHRQVVRGPRSDAGQRDDRFDKRFELARIEAKRAVRNGGRERVNRSRSRAGQSDLRDRVDGLLRNFAGRRKSDAQRTRAGQSDLRDRVDGALRNFTRRRKPHAQGTIFAIERLAERSGESTGKRRSSGNRHLLPEHGANGGFEPVDRAGHAQARLRTNMRREHGVARQRTTDHVGSRIEIEHASHARDQRHQRCDERRRDCKLERVALRMLAHFDDTDVLAGTVVHDASISTVANLLDAGNRARREK